MAHLDVSLTGPIQRRLQELFATTQPVFAVAGGGDTLIELAVRSLVLRRALVVVGGPRGEWAARIVESCGREAVRVCVQPGQPMRPEWLAKFLQGPGFDALLLVHVEPTTAVEAPLQEIVRLAHARGIPVVADVSHSIGRAALATDGWGIDLAFAAGDGALGLSPGVGFGAASVGAVDRARRMPARGWTTDLVLQVEAARRGESVSVLPEGLLAGP